MRCPNCKARFVKSTQDNNELFIKKLVISKSTGAIIVICSSCKKPCAPDAEMLDILRQKVFVTKEK